MPASEGKPTQPLQIVRFAVIGQKATASDIFILDDLPGTSGRLDVLVRCLRAAFLTSHGLRRDVVVYLVLLGGPRAPRVVRFTGTDVKFLRPDERSLAVLAKKVLAHDDDAKVDGFVQVKPGISLARGGVERVLEDAPGATPFLLDDETPDVEDIRSSSALAETSDVLFVIGDHEGIPASARALLAKRDARAVSLGPVSVHADDVVAIVTNEIDRMRRADRR